MKNLILLLNLILAFSFSLAWADSPESAKVKARGYGSTYEEQVLDAQLQALSNAIGSFIIGDKRYNSDKNKVIQDIREYHGGYIESFNIIANSIEYVDIEAVVKITKDNRMYVPNDNEIDIEKDLKNYKDKRNIIEYLDDPQQAFHIKIDGIHIEPHPHKIRFKINTYVMWQPKWVSDLETFVTEFTDKGKTSQNINIRMVSQRGFQPGVSIIQSLFESKPKQNDTPMVCFAGKPNSDVDGCRNLAGGFQNMPMYSEMPMWVKGYNEEDTELFSKMIMVKSTNLYESVYRNQTKSYFLTKRTFDQPAFIVYKNGKQQFISTIDIDNHIAENIRTFKIEATK